MTASAEVVLSERANRLLKAVVERYIRDGKAVGSRALARDAELSAATIRNVMADLEELGLISSPHTSAGRMPTISGYRYFIDRLLTVQPLEGGERRFWQGRLNPDQSINELATATSDQLSMLTSFAGLVMTPRPESMILRQIAFLTLSKKRVLAILVVNEREVLNRVISTERHYTVLDLEGAARYLNESFAGQTLEAIRASLQREMLEDRQGMGDTLDSRALTAAVSMGVDAFSPPADLDSYVLKGEEKLLGCLDLDGREQMRRLFEAFNRKRDLLYFLDQCLTDERPQVFIGAESGCELLEQCSVVTAPYAADGQVLGVVAVIGPTRMPYERVLPVVELAAELLGAALHRRSSS